MLSVGRRTPPSGTHPDLANLHASPRAGTTPAGICTVTVLSRKTIEPGAGRYYSSVAKTPARLRRPSKWESGTGHREAG
jgi:hypothetical protein